MGVETGGAKTSFWLNPRTAAAREFAALERRMPEFGEKQRQLETAPSGAIRSGSCLLSAALGVTDRRIMRVIDRFLSEPD